MNDLSVLHVVGSSRFGGGAQIIFPLAAHARSEGWRVDILVTDPVFQQMIRDSGTGVGIVDLDVIHREIRPLWDVRGLFRLARYLREHPYTVVHTHTSKAGLVGRVAAKLAGVPVVVHTVHG
ncbi:MAG: glycosyltransferase, partial [Acidobacteriia bacterium]|nr:glycosyltransferase [Terriglobia bacterium]